MSIPGSATPLLLATTAAAAADFQIDRSLRFDSSSSGYLSRTPSSAGNRKTWTLSFWVKLCGSSGHLVSAGNDAFQFEIRSDGQYLIANTGCFSNNFSSDVFRDYSAWQHFVIEHDATNTYCKIYINGSLQKTITATNADGAFNNNTAHNFNGRSTSLDSFTDFYLAQVHFIDGQALSASDFGEYDSDGNWNPKEYSGSYGGNSFKLDFSDNTSTTTIAEDSSGENNDFTATNISISSGAGNDSLLDSPTNYDDGTNVGGNYATLNPLDNGGGTLSNGNLDVSYSSHVITRSTFAVSSGKWYWEVAPTGQAMIGIATQQAALNSWLASDAYGWGYYSSGPKYNNGSGTSYGSSYTSGDIIGIALDLDAGTLVFYKNGVSQGTAYSGLASGFYLPAVGHNTMTAVMNFGARPFAYTPPTNHLPLVTTSLSDPTITDPSTVMDVALWTGNSGTQTISGLGFSPDLVWGKCRSNGSTSHHVYDQVRTAGEALFPNSTNAEVTYTNYLTAFTSDGFTLGSGSELNYTGRTFVGWCWDGGTSTAANTDGSITSNVRANQSAGFSIASYTGNGTSGSTVGHGLNAKPGIVIIKSRSIADNWLVAHDGAGVTGDTLGGFSESYTLFLESSAAKSNFTNAAAALGNSSVFAIADGPEVNQSSTTYIAYCFSPVNQYSFFGSFEGNGSSDGPFVYTGFRSKWIMFKNSDISTSWLIYDSARDTFNVADLSLQANTAGRETTVTNDDIDILSNGFKIRVDRNDLNASGNQITVMAFAENPFKTARAR